MTPAELFEQIAPLYPRLVAQCGEFTLFAVVQLEGRRHWDLVVAAPWLDRLEKLEGVQRIASYVQKLPMSVLREVGRVEVLRDDDPRVGKLLAEEASFAELFDVPVRHLRTFAPGRPKPRWRKGGSPRKASPKKTPKTA